MTDKLIPLSELPEEDQKLIQAIHCFWFGHSEESANPSADRFELWFNPEPITIQWLKDHYQVHIEAAGQGHYDHWLKTIQGQLAYIILLDQWTKFIYESQPEAYAYDAKALSVCMQGATQEEEHALTLIERAFYYFPLLHSEDGLVIENAFHAYSVLEQYALEETKKTYQKFLDIAVHHAKIIHTYGRFPTRNAILCRENSENELLYLKALEEDHKLDIY
jgi:uncharacterized protein (DUF924 family)